MRTIIIFSTLLLCVYAVSEKEYQNAFINWMKEHKRTYHHAEFNTRYAIFKDNYDYVEKNNAEENGMILSLNQFADLESSEFANLYLGYKASTQLNNTSTEPIISAKSALPESWNWVDHGAVTGIKNQEQCGACWSFSTTGSTEGCHQISTGSLVSLSEQNLIDCSTSYGNKGCNGGAMVDAMQYIINNGGIDTESSYPYTAEDGTCQYNAANSAATLSSYVNVASGSESDLKQKASAGPVSVAIDASLKSFQLYKSGIYYEAKCSSTALDHGVLVVGWGKSSQGEYWIVKNSWGTSWGIEGYIWMARNRGNNCGIATAATLPTC